MLRRVKQLAYVLAFVVGAITAIAIQRPVWSVSVPLGSGGRICLLREYGLVAATLWTHPQQSQSWAVCYRPGCPVYLQRGD